METLTVPIRWGAEGVPPHPSEAHTFGPRLEAALWVSQPARLTGRATSYTLGKVQMNSSKRQKRHLPWQQLKVGNPGH